MALYKDAGAKYFVSMGVHHDNFDLWNSKYHRWNATKIGPMRDVVGEWQRAAKKQGLHFGVSEHLGASYTWFQASHGADKQGPLAGVPYDGNDPRYEDLYHPKAKPGDNGWYSNDPQWHAEWYRRIKDLVDSYHPDLLYSDGGIPFGDVGASMVAHLYNSSIALHHGRQEAVYTSKQASGGRWTQDLERGVQGGIQKYPWQTDTSIGDWFYNKDWKYRGADWVIKTLVDVVSKNGNLLINVVLRPDGSLDDEAMKILADMTAWMKVNSESIYNTTPWITYGEGPVRAKGGMFKEDFDFTAKDVRYASKGDGVVYATLMGLPDEANFVLKSLPKEANSKAVIKNVRVLGAQSPANWVWLPDGLHVSLTGGDYSNIATVLKITGTNLRSFTVESLTGPAKPVILADVRPYCDLNATAAETHGDGIAVETKDGIDNLGYWDNPEDWASWRVNFQRPGTYDVQAIVASVSSTMIDFEIGGKHLLGNVPNTGHWGAFINISLGQIAITKSGVVQVAVRAADQSKWKAMNLRGFMLKRIQ